MSSQRTFAFIAGSGLGEAAAGFEVASRVSFEEIPEVGGATVAGHRGEVLRCRMGNGACWIVLGRRHIYEGAVAPVRALVSWLARQGVTDLVTASAAGSLRTTLEPGALVLVSSVLDLQSRHAGMGRGAGIARGDRRRGVDPGLCLLVEQAAARAGVTLHRGVAACLDGPTYETPAEVSFLQGAGADLATMSAAPEIAAAGENGLRVACIGAITNPGTGIGKAAPGHGAVLTTAEAMAPALGRILTELV